jgi:PTH1 family peptidyl-tRNA hydrolase
VGKPPTETGRAIKAGGTSYLLSPMRRMQLQELDEALDQAVRAVQMVLVEGVRKAMNEFNRKVTGEAADNLREK